MHPMDSGGDHFLAYCLTKVNESAEQLKESRTDPRSTKSLQEEEELERRWGVAGASFGRLRCYR